MQRIAEKNQARELSDAASSHLRGDPPAHRLAADRQIMAARLHLLAYRLDHRMVAGLQFVIWIRDTAMLLAVQKVEGDHVDTARGQSAAKAHDKVAGLIHRLRARGLASRRDSASPRRGKTAPSRSGAGKSLLEAARASASPAHLIGNRCISRPPKIYLASVPPVKAWCARAGTRTRQGRNAIPSIVRQRDIIDRRALAEQLSAVVPVVRSPALDRGAFVAPLKTALSAGHAEIRRRFEATGDGSAVMREQCFLMDQLVRALFDLVTGEIFPLPNPTSGERLAIIAVGGYGRGELAPYSDIDLLFLLPYKRTPYTEQVVEYLLYLLWDLGLKIGQATRSVEECLRQAKSDLTIRTGLLEARFLTGEETLFQELKRRFDSD